MRFSLMVLHVASTLLIVTHIAGCGIMRIPTAPRNAMSREAVNVESAATVGPYSHACAGGGLLFLSGQTPVDPATGTLVTGSIQAQTQQCFVNLFAVLEAAGLTPDDVVNVQVYLVDMRDFAAMNGVYATHFGTPYPARTTIGVASLPLGAGVEIGLVARTR